MKKVLFTALALSLSIVSFAQEQQQQPQKPEKPSNGWSHKGVFGINLSQSSYTNWASGGQSSINGLGIIDYELHYMSEKFTWNTELNASLGYSFTDFKKKPTKTEDKIELRSMVGLKATEHFFYSGEVAFRSQFAKGYDYSVDSTHYISKFLAPAYINFGLGMEWVPNDYFSIYLSPVSSRLTIVNDDRLASEGAFGVNELDKYDTVPHTHVDKVRYEFGARFVAKVSYPITDDIFIGSKLELFSNYLNHPERVDVDWQNLILLKVNDWLNCNLTTHLIYDYDIPFYDENHQRIEGSKVQFKEVLSVGLTFKLK